MLVVMEELREIEEWINRLKDCGKLIVVEGMKDKNALISCGISSIHTLNKKPLYACIEEIATQSKDVIILTDMDPEGKKLYGTVSSGLQHHGVRIDNYFREFLFKKTKLRQIEGLYRYVERMRKENCH